MRGPVIVLLPLVLACATRPMAAPAAVPDASTTRTVRDRAVVVVPGGPAGSVAAFVAAVPATVTGGECEMIPVGGGSRILLLAFPARTRAERNVALTLDAAGTLVNYSDLRGDLRAREQRTGAVTAVMVSYDQGTASASNEWPDRPMQLVFGLPAEILAADNLGRPGEMVKEVLARCAPPSPM